MCLCCRLPFKESELNSRYRREVSFSYKAFRPAQEAYKLPIQWVLGVSSTGIKRSRREAGHRRPSSAKVMNASSYASTIMAWCLTKHRDNFNFTKGWPWSVLDTNVTLCKSVRMKQRTRTWIMKLCPGRIAPCVTHIMSHRHQ